MEAIDEEIPFAYGLARGVITKSGADEGGSGLPCHIHLDRAQTLELCIVASQRPHLKIRGWMPFGPETKSLPARNQLLVGQEIVAGLGSKEQGSNWTEADVGRDQVRLARAVLIDRRVPVLLKIIVMDVECGIGSQVVARSQVQPGDVLGR